MNPMRENRYIITLAITAMIGMTLATGFGARIGGTSGQNEQKLDRGGKVIVRGRTGSIKIAGWERDVIRATATRDGRDEQVGVRISEEAPGSGVWVITPDGPGGDLFLDVRLPRYAEVKMASLSRGDIEITGVEGAVEAHTGGGDVRISKAGSVKAVTGSGDIEVTQIAAETKITTGSGDIQGDDLGSLDARTRSGDVSVSSVGGQVSVTSDNGDVSGRDIRGDFRARALHGDIQASNIGGLVVVTATSGSLIVRDAGRDVRATTAAGDITVNCAKGQVNASTAAGSLNLAAVDGNVEARTASGVVDLRTVLRANGRYYLESLSGEVRMLIQADPPGFTASLTTYSGSLETEFPLELDLSARPNRRMSGRYGDGQARISLDTFSGTVKLGKLGPGMTRECK